MVQRWCKKDNKYVEVPRPQIVVSYNAGMGGVDLFDMFQAFYRLHHKCRKGYMRFFFWILGTAVINAWCLCCRIMKQQGVPIAKQLHLLQFTCSVSHSLAEATIRRKGRGRPSIEAPSVPTDKLPGKHLKWHHRQIFALILSTIGLFIGHIVLAAFTVGNNLNGMWKVQKRPVCEKLLQRLP